MAAGALLLTLFAGDAVSQCNYSNTYSSAAGWTLNGGSYSIGPNVFQFNNTPCDAYNFAVRQMPCTLSDDGWCADIDFFYQSRDPFGVAHTLLSFTSNAANSWNALPGYSISNNNVIEVYLNSPPNAAAGTESISANSKSGITWGTATTPVNVTPGNTYFLRLQRLSLTQGLLTIYQDAARTIQFAPPQCFTIAATVTNLNFVQHGCIPQGYVDRRLRGTLDNLAVTSLPFTGIIGMPPVVCTGTPRSVCVSAVCGNATYSWSVPGGTFINSGQGTSCITFTAGNTSGPVSCTINYPGATCPVTYTVMLTVQAPPTVTASASAASVCPGTPVTLTASGASTYSWGPPVSQSGAVVNYSPAASFTVTVTGVSTAGCSSTNTVTVSTFPQPVANAGPPVYTCCGSTSYLGAALGSASGGTPPYTYSWSPTTNFTGCTNCPNPPMMMCGATTPINYTLTVTDFNGCISTSTVTATFNNCRLANPENDPAVSSVNEGEITVAPNPADGHFTVTFTDAGQHDLEVVNLLGERVYKKSGLTGSSAAIDLSGMPKGVYILKCRQGEEVFTQRIIVQ